MSGPGAVPPEQPRGRTGSEPSTARSPLRLRTVLAAVGGAFCLVMGVALLLVPDAPAWAVALGVVLLAAAAAAAIDLVVLGRRLRRRR